MNIMNMKIETNDMSCVPLLSVKFSGGERSGHQNVRSCAFPGRDNARRSDRKRNRNPWEIGVGGSLINWSRVSITGFQSTSENYLYNLKDNHLMGGANLYVARGVEPVVFTWIYRGLSAWQRTTTVLQAVTGNMIYCTWEAWGCNSVLPPCSNPNGWSPILGWG